MSIYSRYDTFYTYNSNRSTFSGDSWFNGTSSACPIAAGIIATKLETNRTWTYTDVKNWLTTDVGQQNTADFYYGSEGTTPNDSSWADKNSLQGGPAIVAYDAQVSNQPGGVTVFSFSGSNLTFSGNVTIS